MNRCKETQEWIDCLFDEDASVPNDIAKHLESCSECQAYQHSLATTINWLEDITIPDAPASLPNQVMAYIDTREEETKQAKLYIPGLIFFRQIWTSFTEYIPSIYVPPVLKKEAWPTAFASIVIIWGSMVVPLAEGDEPSPLLQNRVVEEVNLVANSLREKSEYLTEKLSKYTHKLLPPEIREPDESGKDNADGSEILVPLSDE